jgi:hypothetical protein
MAKANLSVKVIQNVDKDPELVAGITVYAVRNKVEFEVRSQNDLIKRFLEDTLNSGYFGVAPGPKMKSGYYANHAEYYYPNTMNFFLFVADRLSWYGFIVDYISKAELKKSLFSDDNDFIDYDEDLYIKSFVGYENMPAIYKSFGGAGFNYSDYFRQNSEGDTIMLKVPPGYIAVSNDGKVVAGGGRIGRQGVNLDKEDAKWRLTPSNKENEELYRRGYQEGDETSQEELEERAWDDEKFHPSAIKQAYEDRDEPFSHPYFTEKIIDFYNKADPIKLTMSAWIESPTAKKIRDNLEGAEQIDRTATPMTQAEADELQQLRDLESASYEKTQSVRPTQTPPPTADTPRGSEFLPSHVVAFSPKLGLLVSGQYFRSYAKFSKDWMLFDSREYFEMSTQEKQQAREQAYINNDNIHPGLVAGVFAGPIRVKPKEMELLNLSRALPHDIADIKINQINSLIGDHNEESVVFMEDMEQVLTAQEVEELYAQRSRTGSVKDRESAQQQLVDKQKKKDYDLKKLFFARNQYGITAIKDELLDADPNPGVLHLSPGGNNSENIYMNGGLRPYQEYGVKFLTDESRYGVFGGAEESQGVFVNWAQGIGKTLTVLSADAVMRNKGLFDRSTLIVCPNNVIGRWREDITKYRLSGQSMVIIDGSPAEREAQWQRVAALHAAGTPPKYVVMGAGKVRYSRTRNAITDDLETDYSSDIKWIQTLSAGNVNVGGKRLTRGAFDAMVIDETGLYSNPKSKRHGLMRSLTTAITSSTNRGIIWGLNGDFSSNSAVDAISELSWVNKEVRENFDDIVDEFTVPVHPQSTRRIFISANRFLKRYGNNINTVSRTMAVGENRRISTDMHVPLGEEYYEIYQAALKKFEDFQSADPKIKARMKLGLLSILGSTSFGAVSPARIMEYGIRSDLLLNDALDRLQPEEVSIFMQEINNYVKKVTRNTDMGVIPNFTMPIDERNAEYEALSPNTRKVLQDVVDDWNNPLANRIIEGIEIAMASGEKANDVLRMGLAGLSRAAIESIFRKLRKKFTPAQLRVQIITGGMTFDEVDKISKEHSREPTIDENGNYRRVPPVITLVTGAATHGINLPSDFAWRFVTWSNGRAQQLDGRFQRNPFDWVTLTRLIPNGMPNFMKELEDSKGAMSKALESLAGDSDVDGGDESTYGLLLHEMDERSLLEKLLSYPVRVERRN